jgi:hypothetical protein
VLRCSEDFWLVLMTYRIYSPRNQPFDNTLCYGNSVSPIPEIRSVRRTELTILMISSNQLDDARDHVRTAVWQRHKLPTDLTFNLFAAQPILMERVSVRAHRSRDQEPAQALFLLHILHCTQLVGTAIRVLLSRRPVSLESSIPCSDKALTQHDPFSMLADLDNRLKYRQLSAKGVRVFGKVNLTGAWIAWVLFGLGATLAWLYRNDVLDASNREFQIHPNFNTGMPNGWTDTEQDYWLPSVVDFVWVMSFFLLCDFSPAVRTFFQLSEYHSLCS